MDIKKILGLLFTLLDAGAVVYGIITLFGGDINNALAWSAAVLGFIFMGSGIGLLKSIKTVETE